jgi:hypothetical protein
MHQDPIFGKLTWEDHLEWWTGQVDFAPGHSIQVALSTTEKELETLLAQARPLLARIRREEADLRQATTEALLELYNTAWNEGAAIDGARFAACITLQTVIFYPDGNAELFYDDDDLFAGHTLLVSLDTHGALQDATLAG